jgi:hypothetical protein
MQNIVATAILFLRRKKVEFADGQRSTRWRLDVGGGQRWFGSYRYRTRAVAVFDVQWRHLSHIVEAYYHRLRMTMESGMMLENACQIVLGLQDHIPME